MFTLTFVPSSKTKLFISSSVGIFTPGDSTEGLDTCKEIDLFFKNIFKKYTIFIFIFFYIFLWKLDQVAGFRLEGKPNGIFKSSLFAEFVKLIKFIYTYVDLNIIDLPEIKL